MNRHKWFLLLQSILCIALALLLALAAIRLCREGLAARAEDPLAPVFSREKVAACFRPLAPLFFVSVGVTALGLSLGVKDDTVRKPGAGGELQNRSAAGGGTLRAFLLLAAVGLIAAGVFNGSARDVFGKAVKICTECVGLG